MAPGPAHTPPRARGAETLAALDPPRDITQHRVVTDVVGQVTVGFVRQDRDLARRGVLLGPWRPDLDFTHPSPRILLRRSRRRPAAPPPAPPRAPAPAGHENRIRPAPAP